MKTVGQMLKEARLKKGLSLEDIERETKIRIQFLKAIEQDEYHKLPSLAYAKGFIKNYSQCLGIHGARIMAFFRRQIQETPRSSLLPRGVSEPLNAPLFRLTPTNFIAFILCTIVGVLFVYFVAQYRNLKYPPALVIESPQENAVVTEQRIDVIGRTDEDATITIQGISVLVRDDGKFLEHIVLEEGLNTITVEATSRYGKKITETRAVTYLRAPDR